MPDLMQFKRGPLANIGNAKLILGEPAFLYDKKIFCIGTGEGNEPVYFLSEKETKHIINALSDSLQQSIYASTADISNLNTLTENLDARLHLTNETIQINYESIERKIESLNTSLETEITSNMVYVKTELDKKINTGKIKSSDLSTAYDADKIGLSNLKQEVISYINNNGGGSGNGGESTTVAPNSIGFDLLSTEVVQAIQEHDFGTFKNPLENIDVYSAQNAMLVNAAIPNSIGFDLLSAEVVATINNNNFGEY